jgi:hypothetical protein
MRGETEEKFLKKERREKTNRQEKVQREGE